MREILFRFYDKEEGRYRQLDGLHDTMMIDRDGKASYYNLQNGSGGDEYIIEQFTGMIDYNGNKIFDGDIIESLEHGKSGEVYFQEGGFGTTEWELCKVAGRSLVIGNIHDNPELLEV